MLHVLIDDERRIIKMQLRTPTIDCMGLKKEKEIAIDIDLQRL